jgi:hypothetical protein
MFLFNYAPHLDRGFGTKNRICCHKGSIFIASNITNNEFRCIRVVLKERQCDTHTMTAAVTIGFFDAFKSVKTQSTL